MKEEMQEIGRKAEREREQRAEGEREREREREIYRKRERERVRGREREIEAERAIKAIENNSSPGRQMGNVIIGADPGSKSTSKLMSSGVSLACKGDEGR